MYTVSCRCGETASVTASQAGAEVACPCGRSIAVPRLSELRKTMGLGAFESGILDTVRRKVAAGELPAARDCALTSWPTSDTCEVLLYCEQRWVRDPGKWNFLLALLYLMISPLLMIWAMRDDGPKEERGRDTVIRVPLRIAADERASFQRIRRQSKLRQLLRSEPLYAQLLDEYPRTRVLHVH